MKSTCDPMLKRFGRELKRWLYTKKTFSLMPQVYDTWVAGGCWVLARALHEWIGPESELWAIYSWADSEFISAKIPQHVVVKIGNCYVDGDGISSEQELLYRWYVDEGLHEPELYPADAEELENVNIQCPIGAVRDMTKALFEKFGPGDHLVR